MDSDAMSEEDPLRGAAMQTLARKNLSRGFAVSKNAGEPNSPSFRNFALPELGQVRVIDKRVLDEALSRSDITLRRAMVKLRKRKK